MSREYYDDNTLWSVWDGTGEIASGREEGEEKQRLYIRGKGNTRITGDSSLSEAMGRRWVINGTQGVNGYSNLMLLLDYDKKHTYLESNYAMAALFYNTKLLKYPPRISFYPKGNCTIEGLFNSSGIVEASLITNAYHNSSYLKPGSYAFGGVYAGCTELESSSYFVGFNWVGDYMFQNTYHNCKKLKFNVSSVNNPNNIIGYIDHRSDYSVCGENTFLGTSGSYTGGVAFVGDGIFVYNVSNGIRIIKDKYNVKFRHSQ